MAMKLNLGGRDTQQPSTAMTPVDDASGIELGEDFDTALSEKAAEPREPAKDEVRLSPSVIIKEMQHQALLEYLHKRLEYGYEEHKNRVDRYTAIDKEVNGFIRLSDDDKLRKRDTEKGFGVKAYNVSLQLVKVQIDEAVTFLTSVFFPEEGPYMASAPADKQDAAKAVTTLLNEHSANFSHFACFNKFCTDSLQYNLGMMIPNWRIEKGSIVKNDETRTGATILHDQELYAGNELIYADPYNTLIDPTVSPINLRNDGEFFATVDMISSFRINRMVKRKELFNVPNSAGKSTISTKAEAKYYTPKPDITGDAGKGRSRTHTDWKKILTASTDLTVVGELERVKMHIWIPAEMFGLSSSDTYELWRFEILDATHITYAEHVDSAHGKLPIVCGMPWDSAYETETQSYAEILLPYQRFSSFQMNIHQEAARKAVYGLTFYLEKLAPQMADADLVAAKIPITSIGELEDIKKSVYQITDAPSTANTMNDIEGMSSIMQKILPTDMAKQVAGLERATQYQSAATVQGANRRNLKIAQLLESQAFGPARRMFVYNVLQYQEAVTVYDPETREPIEINPADLREVGIATIVGAGLRGLDKLILVESLKEMLGYLVQSSQAQERVDMVAIINYITSLIGDHTSFSQFEFKTEFDKLDMQQKEMAFQLLQQAMQQQAAAEQQGAQPQ